MFRRSFRCGISNWYFENWRSSVKARHFVFALHDYYIDRLTNPHIAGVFHHAEDKLSALGSVPHTPTFSQAGTDIDVDEISSRLEEIERDAWCLPFLSVSFAPAILEAIDDDSSSFVKIKEANSFSSSRPYGWSLPQWMAYWAIGAKQQAVDFFH